MSDLSELVKQARERARLSRLRWCGCGGNDDCPGPQPGDKFKCKAGSYDLVPFSLAMADALEEAARIIDELDCNNPWLAKWRGETR
jgi:hypothetical protein